jgi:hypothetical protein
VDLASATANPAGSVSRALLSRAVLRIHGLGISDVKRGETFWLRLFVNSSGIKSDTPGDDVRCAGEFEAVYQGPGATLVVADVTSGVKRLMEEGRPFHLTLTAGRKQFWYRRMELALMVASR